MTNLGKFFQDPKKSWRLGLIAAFVIYLAIIFPKSFTKHYRYEIGKPWSYPTLEAPFDFSKVKDQQTIEQERDKAGENVAPVFLLDSSRTRQTLNDMQVKYEAFAQFLHDYQKLKGHSDQAEDLYDDRKDEFYKVDVPELIHTEHDLELYIDRTRDRLLNTAGELYERGLLDEDEDLKDELVSLREDINHESISDVGDVITLNRIGTFVQNETKQYPPYTRTLIEGILTEFARPNYQFNDSLTEAEQQFAMSSVSPVFGKVKKGELIIRKGDVVTRDVAVIIESLEQENVKRSLTPGTFELLIRQLVVIGIITFLLVQYLRFNRPRIFYRNRKLAMVLLIFAGMISLSLLVQKLSLITLSRLDINYLYLAPACMVPILITAFFDTRFGFFSNLLNSLYIGIIAPNGFEYFFVQAAAGTVAVFTLTRLRTRRGFFVTLLYILVTYWLVYLAYSFYQTGSGNLDPENLALFAINVLLTLIAYPLAYVFERIFRITSDLTYMELLDTNHPLLKDLSMKAPGTFQHSLHVASMAEAAINKIGGNGLQIRVGALFHDIGKMTNPRFFIENTRDGENPHNELSPEVSARIIISHVTEGIRLAQEHRLPSEIIDFIRTHHGNQKVEFFYRQYIRTNPDCEVEMFTYPGPLPSTKEQAVLMLTDSIEAACRSLTKPSQDDILQMVHRIIEQKIQAGQLVRANITFKDVEDIREVCIEQLISIYHPRVVYN